MTDTTPEATPSILVNADACPVKEEVPHHGSKTGLDEALIAQLRPTTAFIPVGQNNYGHPANENVGSASLDFHGAGKG